MLPELLYSLLHVKAWRNTVVKQRIGVGLGWKRNHWFAEGSAYHYELVLAGQIHI